jgi:glycyl-tRNA synthetase
MKSNYENPSSIEKIVSLCKRRGFFSPSYEIYSGLNGVYDKGHLGVLLSKKVCEFWEKHIKLSSEHQMFFHDGSILGHKEAWTASGHVEGFHDPLIDCKSCKVRYRTDEINIEKSCPRCGKKDWSEIRQFNMMFSTTLGASSDSGSISYLRPETAQSIFSQFKQIFTSSRAKIPFGVMQIGKAFRNEITPRQFLFRMREFSQMEMEFFVHPNDAERFFEFWTKKRINFYKLLNFDDSKINVRHYEKSELAHYSKATVDIEYDFSFGLKELEGIAYRGDFDLKQHIEFSKKDLMVFDDSSKSSYIPHVIECSVGVERLMFAILENSYKEENLNGEIRILLSLPKIIAPIQIAIFPLTDLEEELANKIYKSLLNNFSVQFDSSGSIGKRYRRQDEIGTPFCLTIDQNSRENGIVTIRERDSMKQISLNIENIDSFLKKEFEVLI